MPSWEELSVPEIQRGELVNSITHCEKLYRDSKLEKGNVCGISLILIAV
jgi:hypothetical protein